MRTKCALQTCLPHDNANVTLAEIARQCEKQVANVLREYYATTTDTEWNSPAIPLL